MIRSMCRVEASNKTVKSNVYSLNNTIRMSFNSLLNISNKNLFGAV